MVCHDLHVRRTPLRDSLPLLPGPLPVQRLPLSGGLSQFRMRVELIVTPAIYSLKSYDCFSCQQVWRLPMPFLRILPQSDRINHVQWFSDWNLSFGTTWRSHHQEEVHAGEHVPFHHRARHGCGCTGRTRRRHRNVPVHLRAQYQLEHLLPLRHGDSLFEIPSFLLDADNGLVFCGSPRQCLLVLYLQRLLTSSNLLLRDTGCVFHSLAYFLYQRLSHLYDHQVLARESTSRPEARGQNQQQRA